MKPFANHLLPRARPLFAFSVIMTLAVSSCTKVSITLPGPPGTALKSLEKFPFQEFIDSSNAKFSAGDVRFTFKAVTLQDIRLSHYGAPGQAEFALVFRTSKKASVTSLALLLPASGYSHTVTLWDSATGAVLAQTNVPSLNAGNWTSVSLAANNKAVAIVPGKGYIVGYNSLAVGSTIGTASPGNQLYNFDGIFYINDNGGKGETLPILPFTKGAITFEAGWEKDYDTPITGPIFPGKTQPNESPQSLYGMMDIGYITSP